MNAHFTSWLQHLKPGQWYVLAVLAVVLLVAFANHFFARRLWLMAKVLNWRSTTYGKETRYYVMLAFCGDGDAGNRLDTQKIEVSRDDYASAVHATDYFAVDCSISFLLKAITVKSPVLRPWLR